MNNKLLATLFTFTIASFFTSSCTQTFDQRSEITDQKPTNAEMVEYLQMLKKPMLIMMSELKKASKFLKEEYGSQWYEEVININSDLYPVVVSQEAIAFSVNFSFDNFTREELERAKQISIEAIVWELEYRCPRVGPYTLQPEQAQKVKSIFAKYGKDNSKSAEDLINDYFLTEDNGEISSIIDMTRYLNTMLQKIDAAIVKYQQ